MATRRRHDALFVENFAQKHRPRARSLFASSARVRSTPAGLFEDLVYRTYGSYAYVLEERRTGQDGCHPTTPSRARHHPSSRATKLFHPLPSRLLSSTATAPSFPANFFQILAPSTRPTLETSISFSVLPFVATLFHPPRSLPPSIVSSSGPRVLRSAFAHTSRSTRMETGERTDSSSRSVEDGGHRRAQ